MVFAAAGAGAPPRRCAETEPAIGAINSAATSTNRKTRNMNVIIGPSRRLAAHARGGRETEFRAKTKEGARQQFARYRATAVAAGS